MSEISREEAIEWLETEDRIKCGYCKYKDCCGACNGECEDIVDKAISDMKKLQKIEKICQDYHNCDGYATAKAFMEIEKILEEY